MVKINKPNNYKNVIEAIKEVCGIEYGFPANWKGIIDALAMCLEASVVLIACWQVKVFN